MMDLNWYCGAKIWLLVDSGSPCSVSVGLFQTSPCCALGESWRPPDTWQFLICLYFETSFVSFLTIAWLSDHSNVIGFVCFPLLDKVNFMTSPTPKHRNHKSLTSKHSLCEYWPRDYCWSLNKIVNVQWQSLQWPDSLYSLPDQISVLSL